MPGLKRKRKGWAPRRRRPCQASSSGNGEVQGAAWRSSTSGGDATSGVAASDPGRLSCFPNSFFPNYNKNERSYLTWSLRSLYICRLPVGLISMAWWSKSVPNWSRHDRIAKLHYIVIMPCWSCHQPSPGWQASSPRLPAFHPALWCESISSRPLISHETEPQVYRFAQTKQPEQTPHLTLAFKKVQGCGKIIPPTFKITGWEADPTVPFIT